MKNFCKYIITGLFFLFTLITSYAQQKYKLTAFFILNTECPISQNIVQTINRLKTTYPDVDFESVFTAWDNKQQIELFKKKYKLETNIIHDQKHKLIKQLGASKTPEAFLINSSKKTIYKGAINNQYIAIGKRRGNSVSNYLEEAIKDYLLNGFVKISETSAVGCKIEPLKSYDKSRF